MMTHSTKGLLKGLPNLTSQPLFPTSLPNLRRDSWAIQVQKGEARQVQKISQPLFPTRIIGGSEVAPPPFRGGVHFQTSQPHQMRGHGS